MKVRASRPIVRLPMSPGEPAVVMEDWHVEIDGTEYTIPAGFASDGASIPRWLWRVCGTPMQVPRLYGAIFHDGVYSGLFPSLTRLFADLAYCALLIHFWYVSAVTDGLGRSGTGIYARIRNILVTFLNAVSAVCAVIELTALRLCGGSHWHTNTNKGEPNE